MHMEDAQTKAHARWDAQTKAHARCNAQLSKPLLSNSKNKRNFGEKIIMMINICRNNKLLVIFLSVFLVGEIYTTSP